MRKLTLCLAGFTLLCGIGCSGAQAAVPFDLDGNGIYLDDIVKHISSNGITDVNEDGVNNSLDVQAMLRQISPVSVHTLSTGTVTGLVVDQIGEPMKMTAVNLNGTASTAFTNEHGRFTIPGVTASTDNVVTSVVYSAASSPFSILSGETTTLPHPLQVTLPTGTVTGTVYAADMVPLAGVAVKINTGGAASEVLPPVMTDGQGRFVFPNVPVGTRSFFTTSPYGMSGFVVNVKEGMNPAMDIMGVQFVTVSGTATDSRNVPLPGAEITMEMGNGLMSTVTSDSDGKFSFANAIRDMVFTWRMSKPGYLDASIKLMATSSQPITNQYFITLNDSPVTTDSDLEYAVGASVSRFNVNLGGYSGPVKRSNSSSYPFLVSDKTDDPNNQIAFIGGSGLADAGDMERLNAALRDSTVSTIYIYKSIIDISHQELVIPTRPVTITSKSDVFIQAEVATNNMLTWASNVKQVAYGDVFGFVKGPNNERVFGATVTLSGVTEPKIADINGFYHFKNLSMNTYVLSANRSSDYSTQVYPTSVDNSVPLFRNFVLERSAQYIATNMIISNPSAGQTQLTLPVVPDGYTVSIDSSSDILKISTAGAIKIDDLLPQYVTIIFKVMHGTDVGYRSATILVPGQP